MSRRFAVLGLLREEPDHGYELAWRMEERLGSVKVTPKYVYKLLKGLEQDGLIYRIAEEPSGAGPARVVYDVTEQGVRRFAEWMRASAAMAPLYEELHLKVAFSRVPDLPGLIELLRLRERECLALLEKLEQPVERPREAGGRGWARSAAVLVRNADIDSLQTMLRWLQRTCTVMERTVAEERLRAGAALRRA
jgi:DNA-binding PadR family transcriptional regulator